jgi:hypothetical protein
MRHVNGHCRCGEVIGQGKARVFFSEKIPVILSALPNNTVDLLSVPVQ